MQPDLASALEPDVVSALDKQHYLADLIGESDWRLDIDSGMLSFGSETSWRVQLLGTESESSGTWLWAWANAKSRIPEHLLHAARFLKAIGEQHGILEFGSPTIPLSHVRGHTFAAIASGVCRANAYYRCPYDGGALFTLIIDDAFPKCSDPPLQRVVAIFPQAISLLGISDHRAALLRYLGFYGFSPKDYGRTLTVSEGGRVVLTAKFDEQNRLTGMEAELQAVPTRAGESWDEMQLRRMLGW